MVFVPEDWTFLKLLAGEHEVLLVRRYSLLLLDLRLHAIDGLRSLDVERDGLAGQGLHEDLHLPAEAQLQVQRGLLLGVGVRERGT